MRIAMISPPWISVPPRGYGGIEWVVSLLTEELVSRGHDVTLFATGDSVTSAELRYVFEEGPTALMHQALPYAQHLGPAFAHIAAEARAGRRYDVVHDHTAWIALEFAPLLPTPMVHTLHGCALDSERDFFAACRDNAAFVSISEYQTRTFTEISISAVVHNAVDPGAFPFREAKEDYVLSLGRITKDKGQGLAIQAALAADVPIVLAGKVDPGEDTEYFDEVVLPFVDGIKVRFEGEVPEERKQELFAGARALLFPIQWDEPFGNVMIEAMVCGTPVIATPRGAVPEVVRDGETGFLVRDLESLTAAIARLDEISPKECRAHVEENFSPRVMADKYERVFVRVADGG